MISLPSIAYLYEIYKQHPQVQTDTRKLQQGDIYWALKGPNFNGNTFAVNALESGASYAIVDEAVEAEDKWNDRIILVEDGLATLQALAKHHRQQFTIPFIGITGSNGKTTTKELVAAVLSSHFKTYTTQGNLNNHIGVPLTLLSIHDDAQMAVIEMGANHLHEIESYCRYAMPNYGLITNCGKAHLEGFGSEEGVKKGKGELFDYLKSNEGAAFIMQDFDYLVNMSSGLAKVITYGNHSGDLQANANTVNGMLQVNFTQGSPIESIQTQLVGEYNLPNILAAVSIGIYFNVPAEKIKSAIENYTPTNSRSQLLKWHHNDIILDAYNANPSSMKLAIENFAKLSAAHKIVCIGAMKELGTSSIEEHQHLIQLLEKFIWEQVVLVGGDFEKCNHHFQYFNNSMEAKQWFQAQQFSNKHILIKGSRGVQMERLIEA
ncbi:MAG: UDP-N-acetylmuramoyl-tripeptide--D-alanyl-D-alanine ligase [Bacteroidota bacterium]|jgi:UDP-N-acetylmuramoyl-tripeptide--D-alanyl-D-alanine ligase